MGRLQPINDDKRIHMYVLLSRLKSLQGSRIVATQWKDALHGRTITDASSEDKSIESIHFALFST
jgi:hypothetical protein